MKKALIVCGGQFHNYSDSFIKQQDFIIACDKGLEFCKKLNMTPDLFVGDCDSFTNQLPENLPKIVLPHLKDDTDTLFAIKKALELGYEDITLICALGNRLDHTLANLQCLNYIVHEGGKAKILSPDEEIYCLKNDSIQIPNKEGFSLSVFSLSDKCEGVFERGTLYELENATLENTFPVGISNEWKSDSAEIGVKKGILLVINSRIKD